MILPRILPSACAILLVAAGCGPAAPPAATPRTATADHDHGHDHGDDHDAPASFTAAVARLRALGGELAEKLDAESSEAADEAVHGIGHLLEEARALAKQEGLEAAAAAALAELEECFGTVDEAFHSAAEKADPKQALESVKDRLEAAFRKLAEVK